MLYKIRHSVQHRFAFAGSVASDEFEERVQVERGALELVEGGENALRDGLHLKPCTRQPVRETIAAAVLQRLKPIVFAKLASWLKPRPTKIAARAELRRLYHRRLKAYRWRTKVRRYDVKTKRARPCSEANREPVATA